MIAIRMALVAGVLAAFALAGAGCGTLPNRAWCTNLTELTGADCAYDTYQQCMAAISGVSSGNCTQNPRYRETRPRA